MAEDRGTGRVFISYRRQETAWPARQLYELLVDEFGAQRIFKDVDNIEPGDDSVERLQSAVASCDVLLALIGPQWLTITNARGQRRLDDPGDFVRLELETALGRAGVRVIPILVDNAAMPSVDELPPGLRTLTRRQAIEISPVTFDTRRLLNTLHDTLNQLHGSTQLLESAQDPVTQSSVTSLPGPVNAPHTAAASTTQDSGPVAWRSHRVRIRAAAVAAVVLATAVVLFVNRPPGGETGAALTGQTSSPTGSSSASVTAPSGPTPPANSATTAHTAGSTGANVLAHRGGDEDFPLETFESLTNAADDGYAVETDVRWTSDGKAVVVHDEAGTKAVRCDGPYAVSKTTWKQLSQHCRSFPFHHKTYPLTTYASLMEGLSAYPSWVYVEVKVHQNAAQNREFVDEIRSNGLSDRTVVTSTDPDRLRAIAALAPDLPRLRFVSRRVPVHQLIASKLWGVAVRIDAANRAYVTALKKAGLVVVVWTVNEEQGWAEAQSMGADKVLTDGPRAYTAWLHAR